MATVFLRLLAHDDKPAALARAIERLRDGQDSPDVHVVDPESFRQVPGSPFAYWVSEKVRRLFRELPVFEGEGREARRGASTGDDSQRVRASWEVAPATILAKRWVPFSKGGVYSPYYSDVHLLVGWDQCRNTFDGFYGRPGRMIERPEALGYFFRAGLTWPRRTTSGMSVRVLPAGCIFGDKGPTAFASHAELRPLLALMNAKPFSSLVRMHLAAADAAARSYEPGLIQKTPLVTLPADARSRLRELAASCISANRHLDRSNEISHVFNIPALMQVAGETLADRIAAWRQRVEETDHQLAEHQREIDDVAFRLYGIEGEDRRLMEAEADAAGSDDLDESESEDE
jgi:hypothetical protein